MKAERVYNWRLIGYIYPCLDYDHTITDKKKFITNMVSDLYGTLGWYGWHAYKRGLINDAEWDIFDNEDITSPLPRYNFDKGKIISLIGDTLIQCHKEIPSKPTRIRVFPCFSSFVHNKMDGVTGRSERKDTMNIFIDPTTTRRQQSLIHTICHEYNHAVVYNHIDIGTHLLDILERMMMEGLAEHFREKVVGGWRAPWTQAIAKEEYKIYLNRIKEDLNDTTYEKYREIFFNKWDKYPLRFGYTMGYYMIEDFIKNNSKLSWEEIVKIPLRDMFHKPYSYQ